MKNILKWLRRATAYALILFPMVSSGETFSPTKTLGSQGHQRALQNPTLKANSLLRVLTLNVWGVEPWLTQISLSSDDEARFKIIPEAIRSVGPDVIVFQEVWLNARAKQLKEALKKQGYNYFLRKSGPGVSLLRFGNGLLIASMYPLDIDGAKVISFKDHTRLDEGFLAVHKGAIKTRVLGPGNIWIDLYASHLGAFSTLNKLNQSVTVQNGPDHFDFDHLQAKARQTSELVQFVKDTRTSENMLLVADMNTHPHPFLNGEYKSDQFAFEYKAMTCIQWAGACLNLHDSFAELNPALASTAYTYDTIHNPYAKGGYFASEPPGRIDYIFSDGRSLKPVKSDVVFSSPVNVRGSESIMISDHYGVLTIFDIGH